MFFLFKNEASKSCRSVQRHLSDLKGHMWPRRMRHTCTRLAVCWRCKHEGQRPLAKDTSSDNPFCAVCCFHLPGHPTKIRLLHLKQNSWNPLTHTHGLQLCGQECSMGIQSACIAFLFSPRAQGCISDGWGQLQINKGVSLVTCANRCPLGSASNALAIRQSLYNWSYLFKGSVSWSRAAT